MMTEEETRMQDRVAEALFVACPDCGGVKVSK